MTQHSETFKPSDNIKGTGLFWPQTSSSWDQSPSVCWVYLFVGQVLVLQAGQVVPWQQRTQTGRLYLSLQIFMLQYFTAGGTRPTPRLQTGSTSVSTPDWKLLHHVVHVVHVVHTTGDHVYIIIIIIILLFILLSAENLCHVNRPRGPVVKHSAEKNVASVSWIYYHVSETTAGKWDCFFLPSVALFLFKPCLFAEMGASFFFLRHSHTNCGIPLRWHYKRSSLTQAFNKKLDLT